MQNTALVVENTQKNVFVFSFLHLYSITEFASGTHLLSK